jgi:putative sigma-54 modulation protein
VLPVQVPLQLSFRGMAQSDALAAHVRLRAEKLEHLFDRIVSCHVVVELAGHHHRHGDRFHVSINLGLPGHEILVGHAPSDNQGQETAYGAVDQAFDDAGRELEDWVKHRRTQRHDEAANRRTP